MLDGLLETEERPRYLVGKTPCLMNFPCPSIFMLNDFPNGVFMRIDSAVTPFYTLLLKYKDSTTILTDG